MNPLTWKREHLIIWALLMLAGAAGGLVLAWFLSPFSRVPGASLGVMFQAWLHYPKAYLPWAGFGAFVAGGAYYSADLLTGAR